jgi:RNA polymerase sigma-70 factor (ECF subfamily)
VGSSTERLPQGFTAVVEGLDAAFDAAFDELYARAVVTARRIVGSAATAEDIAAEALARTYARWPRVHALPYRDAWVLRVTINLAFRSLRRAGTVALPAIDPDPAIAVAATVDLVRAARGLPRRQRQVVVLRYLADLSEREVAQLLGLSTGTVKTHLHRATATLRDRLDENPEEARRATTQALPLPPA